MYRINIGAFTGQKRVIQGDYLKIDCLQLRQVET